MILDNNIQELIISLELLSTSSIKSKINPTLYKTLLLLIKESFRVLKLELNDKEDILKEDFSEDDLINISNSPKISQETELYKDCLNLYEKLHINRKINHKDLLENLDTFFNLTLGKTL